LPDEVFDPYDRLAPYSTYRDVERPFGLRAPPTVAELGPTAVAWPVTTVGASSVMKAWSAPVTVPASLVATGRKW